MLDYTKPIDYTPFSVEIGEDTCNPDTGDLPWVELQEFGTDYFSQKNVSACVSYWNAMSGEVPPNTHEFNNVVRNLEWNESEFHEDVKIATTDSGDKVMLIDFGDDACLYSADPEVLTDLFKKFNQ